MFIYIVNNCCKELNISIINVFNKPCQCRNTDYWAHDTDWYQKSTNNDIDWYQKSTNNDIDWYQKSTNNDIDWYQKSTNNDIDPVIVMKT
jgi:hypothetical protein